jgi:hypothetical protein
MKVSTRTGGRQGIIAFHPYDLENSKTLESLYLRGPTRFAVGNQRLSGTSLAFHKVGRKALWTAPGTRERSHGISEAGGLPQGSDSPILLHSGSPCRRRLRSPGAVITFYLSLFTAWKSPPQPSENASSRLGVKLPLRVWPQSLWQRL